MRRTALVLAAIAAAFPATADAAEPKLRTAKRKLDAALTCKTQATPTPRQPILFVTGTGSSGAEGYNLVRDALLELKRPICYVEFPSYMTADMQVSAEYLVNAIRVVSRRSGHRIAVVGISQGGLLPRWALTYWPSLRRKVTDVAAVAGPQHGIATFGLLGDACSPYGGCSPAVYQQAFGSKLLRALNNGRDETPGPTAWTTIRSATDEVVQPQTGDEPTSALSGATNLLIQDICPGRTTRHVAALVDSVTIAALVDAIGHRGAARRSRLPADVCTHPFGPGLDELFTATVLAAGDAVLADRLRTVPRVLGEPGLRGYARKGSPSAR